MNASKPGSNDGSIKFSQGKFKSKTYQPDLLRSNSFKFIYPLDLGGSNLKSNLNQVISGGSRLESSRACLARI